MLHGVHILASAVREVLEEECLSQATDENLTVAQMNLLRLIDVGGVHQVQGFARLLGVSAAAASKTVGKLARLGFISREVQRKDRRALRLTLRPKGRSLVRRYGDLKQSKLREALRDLTPDQLSEAGRSLEALASRILKVEPEFEGICMRCTAHFAEYCPLRSLSKGCVFVGHRSAGRATAVAETGRRGSPRSR